LNCILDAYRYESPREKSHSQNRNGFHGSSILS
jgi:hypothetical protein